jgi:hypothetical protein
LTESSTTSSLRWAIGTAQCNTNIDGYSRRGQRAEGGWWGCARDSVNAMQRGERNLHPHDFAPFEVRKVAELDCLSIRNRQREHGLSKRRDPFGDDEELDANGRAHVQRKPVHVSLAPPEEHRKRVPLALGSADQQLPTVVSSLDGAICGLFGAFWARRGHRAFARCSASRG